MKPARYAGPEPTLGALKHQFGWLWALCALPCVHRAAIPLAPIVRRLGEDRPVHALRGRLRCTMCGRRRAGVRLPSHQLGNAIAALPLDSVPAALRHELAAAALREIGVKIGLS